VILLGAKCEWKIYGAIEEIADHRVMAGLMFKRL
jgi:hypothetical protein